MKKISNKNFLMYIQIFKQYFKAGSRWVEAERLGLESDSGGSPQKSELKIDSYFLPSGIVILCNLPVSPLMASDCLARIFFF